MSKVHWLAPIVYLAGCLGCYTTHVSAPKAAPTSALVATLDQMTVAMVHRVNEDGKPQIMDGKYGVIMPYCSGVWVAPSLIVTSFHCVEKAGRPPMFRLWGQSLTVPQWDPTGHTVYFTVKADAIGAKEHEGADAYYSAIVLKSDPEHDLAIVKAGIFPQHPIAQISDSPIENGDEVHIVGHTVGMWWTYMRGYVAGTRRDMSAPGEKVFDALQVTAPVWAGNSGGGAFDSTGKIVGICAFVRRNAPSMSFFVHRDVVRQLVDSVR